MSIIPQTSEHFCKATELHMHHSELPNRHNDLCGGKSVWEVILQNGDFANFEPQPGGGEFGPSISFTYLQVLKELVLSLFFTFLSSLKAARNMLWYWILLEAWVLITMMLSLTALER